MKLIFFLIGILLIFPFALASCDSGQIDINSATLSELDEIIWIGPTTAERIIEERPFDDLEDLDEIYGIGEKKLEDIIDERLACVGDSDDEEIEELDEGNDEEIAEEIKSPDFEKESQIEEVILGSPIEDKVSEEVIYESAEERVVSYSPYFLVIFVLLLVIGFLIAG